MPSADVALIEGDGLVEVETSLIDAAMVLPGADFSEYRRLIIHQPKLQFQEPDAATRQVALTDEQKQELGRMLLEELKTAVSSGGTVELTEEPGPETLSVYVDVRDVSATVLPQPDGGMASFTIGLAAVGSATLILELQDSLSETVLARSAELGIVEGSAIPQADGMLTRWDRAAVVCRRWAEAAQESLALLLRST